MHSLHVLHHFWIAYAFVRHPVAAGMALVLAGVVALAVRRWRK